MRSRKRPIRRTIQKGRRTISEKFIFCSCSLGNNCYHCRFFPLSSSNRHWSYVRWNI
ncbi:SWIM zinc finger family protein [bacterium]|nr:SWIM zinc finger family protein [bacterium]